jgi:hypothetical protein
MFSNNSTKCTHFFRLCLVCEKKKVSKYCSIFVTIVSQNNLYLMFYVYVQIFDVMRREVFGPKLNRALDNG